MKKTSKKKGYVRYSPETLKVAVQAAEAGATDAELAKVCNCTEATLYRWYTHRPEFKAAIEEARKPSTQAADLARLQKRKADIESWLDDYCSSRGQVTETCMGGLGSYIKTRSGGAPDLRLIDRILGVQQDQEFKLSISIAQPEPDDDDGLDQEFE
jgi:transposase-like protein